MKSLILVLLLFGCGDFKEPKEEEKLYIEYIVTNYQTGEFTIYFSRDVDKINFEETEKGLQLLKFLPGAGWTEINIKIEVSGDRLFVGIIGMAEGHEGSAYKVVILKDAVKSLGSLYLENNGNPNFVNYGTQLEFMWVAPFRGV